MYTSSPGVDTSTTPLTTGGFVGVNKEEFDVVARAVPANVNRLTPMAPQTAADLKTKRRDVVLSKVFFRLEEFVRVSRSHGQIQGTLSVDVTRAL